MDLGFFGNFGHRLRLARELPPRLVLAKIAKRLPGTDPARVRIAEIVHSPKDLDPGRLIGFFLSQERHLAAEIDRLPLEFEGRRVLEIGPGPLAGWGPMALFRGAARVYAVDPDWVPGVILDPAVEAAYLKGHFTALAEAFGPRMDYPTFRRRIKEDLSVERKSLMDLEIEDGVDIVLSNSCLEHIDDPGSSMERLGRFCMPDTRFMHLVNLGNHRDRARPFRTIYEMPPDEYHRRFGRHINLLRAPEIERAFVEGVMPTRMVIVDRRDDDPDIEARHDYWRDRHSAEVLSIRTALFVEAEGEAP